MRNEDGEFSRWTGRIREDNSGRGKGQWPSINLFRTHGAGPREESYDLARNNRSASRADLKIILARFDLPRGWVVSDAKIGYESYRFAALRAAQPDCDECIEISRPPNRLGFVLLLLHFHAPLETDLVRFLVDTLILFSRLFFKEIVEINFWNNRNESEEILFGLEYSLFV